jgi:PBSX family phage portal protein
MVKAKKPKPRKARTDARKIRALVLPVNAPNRVDVEKQDEAESNLKPLEDLIRQGRVIPPPFNLHVLSQLPEQNSELNQVIEAMEQNVVGFGWRLEATPTIATALVGARPADGQELEDPDIDIDQLREDVEDEWERVDEFLSYGNWDPDSFTYLRRQQRKDLEATGNTFLELITNRAGEPVNFRHAPSYRMRLSILDEEFTTYPEVRVVGRGSRRRLVTRTRRKRFRRFVQVDNFGSRSKLTWFKEWGDPRPISARTGEVLASDRNQERLANPMIHRRIYAPRTPYGVPRYMGNLLAILGGRAAEEINYSTFRNNQIPSMMLMVSNGQLTQDTIDRIADFAEHHIQGDDNYSRFLIVEAEPDDGVEGGGQVKIEAKPLTQAQHDDALFVKYEDGNADKVRRAWRLPPIIVGRSDDYTRATADTSRRIAEEQVFEPERREEDWHWNRVLVAKGMAFHEFRTNSPNVTNDQDLIRVMAAAEKSGAMTPRLARAILSDILGRPVSGVDSEVVPVDVPFTLTMAEAVKNQANPAEPGQSVTAMKADDIATSLLERLVGVREYMLADLRKRERLLADGRVPGLALSSEEAAAVLEGRQVVVKATLEADTDDRHFLLVDDLHALAFVQLAAPVERDGMFEYEVTSVEPMAPTPHDGLGSQDGMFVEGVKVP